MIGNGTKPKDFISRALPNHDKDYPDCQCVKKLNEFRSMKVKI
jgi:hypothetical protein